MITTFLHAAVLWMLCVTGVFAAGAAPASVYDLKDWKLQIPGPKEIRNLAHHASDYFYVNGENEMVFHLDAAEKGMTPHAHFVRSELRHLANWTTAGTHAMAAEVRVSSQLSPDKVTVLQIHGITNGGQDAPPLLRIAVNSGDLVAVIKTTSNGDRNDTIILKKALAAEYVKLDLNVGSGRLQVWVNGQKKLDRDIAFWKFLNYFKAGCYPQATQGTADIIFRKLSAY